MLTIDQLNAVEAVDSANCRLRGLGRGSTARRQPV